MSNHKMGKKKHFQPPRANALPYAQTLLLGTAWLAGLVFYWEEDDFISATKCNGWMMYRAGFATTTLLHMCTRHYFPQNKNTLIVLF